MSSELKGMAAVAFLILGLLDALNIAASEEIAMGAIVRTLLLLGAAAVFYLWMMRDQRSSDEAAEESMDEIQKQLDVVKEAVKEAKESAEERVEDALEYANMEPAEEPEPEPVAKAEPEPEPVAKVVPDPAPKAISIDVEEDEPEPVPAPIDAPSSEPDDLTRVEGIGPKYRDILVAAGVDTYDKLAAMSQAEIEQAVKDGGGRRSASMSTWAEQAKFAAAGDWDGLAKLQDELTGGRK